MARSALMYGALCVALVACSASVAADRTEPADGSRKIVLIGGTTSEGPGRHDYPSAVRVLERLLKSSPELQSVRSLDIESHPATPGRYGVLSLPTVLVLSGGEVVETIDGAQPRRRYAEAAARVLDR